MLSTSSKSRLLLWVTSLFVFSLLFIPVTKAQDLVPAASSTSDVPEQVNEPPYNNYRGVRIGMGVKDAREKLGKPKSKGKRQDFYIFSDQESAQIFYLNGKVSAVSVDYVGEGSGAPVVMEVFAIEVAPKKNGSVYKMVRYPKAGYWVSYNRTAGKSPIVSITMRKLRVTNL